MLLAAGSIFEKALIVNENMKLLLEKLKLVAPDIVFDDDYLRVRGFLGQVWEVEEKADSKGILQSLS